MNEILLYGSIGYDFWDPENSITAKTVIDQLVAIDGDVTVRISSGGGDVYEGIDIMTALKNHPGEVTVIVESLAASAASFIAVGGGDKVLMRDSSEMMIHRAWTWAEGNADEVSKTLADLERQDTKLANIYSTKAGGSIDDWLAAMSEETWYSAQEAIDAGLADGLVPAAAMVAPVEARRVPSVVASKKKFKYSGRSAAPPPMIPTHTKPSNKKEGETMSFLNKLAQELGMEPDVVRNKLTGFANVEVRPVLNEKVTVSGEVEVTYPADTPIVPTEKVTIEPIIGQEDGSDSGAAVGLTYEVGSVPEGWDVSVDAATGTATVTAPSGAEVGSTVEALIKVNGTTDIPVTLKVRSLSGEPDESTDTGGAPAAPSAYASLPDGMSLVPTAHLDRLNAMARNFGEQQAQLDRKANEDRVDADIRAGRFHVQNRAQALAMLEQNPKAYADVWGSLAKNTFPVDELGHANTAGVNDPADADFNPGQLAKDRRKAKNGVTNV